MPTKRKATKTVPVNWTGPDAVVQFKRAAAAFGRKISSAKNPSAAAKAVLVREGILTRSGKLTSKYK